MVNDKKKNEPAGIECKKSSEVMDTQLHVCVCVFVCVWVCLFVYSQQRAKNSIYPPPPATDLRGSLMPECERSSVYTSVEIDALKTF